MINCSSYESQRNQKGDSCVCESHFSQIKWGNNLLKIVSCFMDLIFELLLKSWDCLIVAPYIYYVNC